MNAMALMYVAFGGAAGSMCRYMLSTLVSRQLPGSFPLGTFTVNVLGAFLLGLMIALIVYFLPNRNKDLHLLLAVGFLGGFTTFSTFTMDAYMLMENGLQVQALLYVFGSVVLSVLAFVAGMWVIRAAFG